METQKMTSARTVEELVEKYRKRGKLEELRNRIISITVEEGDTYETILRHLKDIGKYIGEDTVVALDYTELGGGVVISEAKALKKFYEEYRYCHQI